MKNKVRFLDKVIGKTKLGLTKLDAHSPEICLAGSIICGVVAVGTAIYSTTKLNDIIEEHQDRVEEIEDDSTVDNEKEIKNRVLKEKAKTGVKLVKLYGPTILLTSSSIILSLVSHGKMKHRIAGLSAANASLLANFNNYRTNIKEAYGEEADKNALLNVKDEELVVGKASNGENIIKKEKVVSTTDRYFDELNFLITPETYAGYDKSIDVMRLSLRAQENYMKELLQVDKVLFLNDIRSKCGFKALNKNGEYVTKTDIGGEVGWLIGNPDGDNDISFGVTEVPIKCFDENGYEAVKTALAVSFNCDGAIRTKL